MKANSYIVCYFGLLAERRGLGDEFLESTAGSPAELYAELDSKYQLGLRISDIRVAVNDEFSGWDQPLKDGDRLALLPPMSGG